MDKKIKVAVNGFGRIGRAFLKIAWERPEIEVVAVNDLGSIESLAYLLKYDTVYRTWNHEVKVDGTNLVIDGKTVKVISEKDTAKLPWKDLGIDVVVESTGLFTSYDKAKFHIDDGAKKVVISAPSKGGDGSVPGETILLGVNEDKFGTCDITSNASCTTNAASPPLSASWMKPLA
ncbi:MAG: glyceraldehyde 3-phosphate dehydrogenase NAD-binding domain-containing protein [bacterium]